MTLMSPGSSHASKDVGDDENDVTKQNSPQEEIGRTRIKKVRRSPQKSALEHHEADDKSKNIFGTISLKNVSMPGTFKIPPSQEQLSFKIFQKPGTSPSMVSVARRILKRYNSLPLLNKKLYIDDWSASPRNQCNDSFDPISCSLMEHNQSFDRVANSTATSVYYESIDCASISVSTTPNDNFVSSCCDLLTPLNRVIDPTSSFVAPHDKKFDPTSISNENIYSAPNFVAHTQLNQTSNSEIEKFHPASIFIALTPSSQSVNPEAVNLDPTSNSFAITTPDESFQPMLNSSELKTTVGLSSVFFESKPHQQSFKSETKTFEPASNPVEHKALNQNVKPKPKKVQESFKPGADTTLNQIFNLESNNGELTSKSDGHLPLNQSINPETKNVDLLSKFLENKLLNQSYKQKTNNSTTVFKSAGHTPLNQSNNSETKNVDPEFKSIEHKLLYQNVDENTNNCKAALNQSINSEIMNIGPISKSAGHAPLNQTINRETKNIDPLSKSLSHELFNQSVNHKSKIIAVASKSAENTPLNQSINFQQKNYDRASKSTESIPLNQSVHPEIQSVDSVPKFDKVASESTNHTPLNQSVHFEAKNVDPGQKSVGQKPVNKIVEPKNKRIKLLKSPGHKSLKQSVKYNPKKVKPVSKFVEHKLQKQSVEFYAKKVKSASKSAGHTILIQSINSDTKNIDQASKSAGDKPLNDLFQPMFNSSAISSHDQSMDSASISISSITYSQSIFDPEAKPFVPLSHSVAHPLPSQSFEYTSDDVENLPYSDIAPNFVATHDFTTLSIPHDENFDPSSDIVTQNSPHSNILDLETSFDANTPLNHSFDPGCNSTTLTAHDQNIDLEANLATRTLRSKNSQSQNFNPAAPGTMQIFNWHTVPSQYHQSFECNLNSHLTSNHIEYTPQNQRSIVEPTIEFSKCIPQNQIFKDQPSTLIAFSPKNGSSFDKHSSKNKSFHHESNTFADTAQDQVLQPSFNVVNETSHNQGFYTVSESVTETHPNKSFHPVSNSITRTPHNQRLYRSSNAIDLSMRSKSPTPVPIAHTSHNQSFHAERHSAIDQPHNQNFNSEPALNKPLSNIQSFFSLFKSSLSPHSKNYNPAPNSVDCAPPKIELSPASGFNRQPPYNEDSQNFETKPVVNKLLKQIQKFNSLPLGIDAPPQYHDFDQAYNRFENAQQKGKLSRAPDSNVQLPHNASTLAAPRSQGGPLSEFNALKQQKPNILSEPIFDKKPSLAESFNSVPNIDAPPHRPNSNAALNIIEHSPQNNSFNHAPGSDGQPSHDTSTSVGFVSHNRGYPTLNLAALTQNTEHFESAFNTRPSSITRTSSSSSRTLTPEAEYVEPMQSQSFHLTYLPKFVTRVQQSANYEQVSSFNAFAPQNQTSNSIFNPVSIPYCRNGNPSYGHITTQYISSSSLSSNKEQNQNFNMVRHFKGQTPENPNLNPTSGFNQQPSQNQNCIPPLGFEGQPTKNKNLSLNFGQPPFHEKVKPAHGFNQPSPQIQHNYLEPVFFGQTQINRNFNPAPDFNQERLLNQNSNSVPGSFGKPPKNSNLPARNQNLDSASILNSLSPNIQNFFSASNLLAASHNQNFNPLPKLIGVTPENETLNHGFYKYNNGPVVIKPGSKQKSLQYYLSLSKIWFPTATTLNLDPNPIINELCKLDDINKHSY